MNREVKNTRIFFNRSWWPIFSCRSLMRMTA